MGVCLGLFRSIRGRGPTDARAAAAGEDGLKYMLWENERSTFVMMRVTASLILCLVADVGAPAGLLLRRAESVCGFLEPQLAGVVA